MGNDVPARADFGVGVALDIVQPDHGSGRGAQARQGAFEVDGLAAVRIVDGLLGVRGPRAGASAGVRRQVGVEVGAHSRH